MKKMKFLILLVGLLAMTSLVASAGQITHTVTYDPDKLSLSFDTINNIYTIVEYDGLPAYNFEGSPKLPTDILTFSVPYNAKNFSVQLQSNSHYDIYLTYHIMPQQQSMAMYDPFEQTFTEPDPIVYGAFDFIPSQTSEVLTSGYLMGDNKVVSVKINPFTYNPAYKIVRLATSATITLSYDVDTTIVPPIIRYNLNVKGQEISKIEDYVANGYYIPMNSYMFTQPNPNNVQQSLPTYSYCIITTRELEPAFKKILAMKRQKGLSAGVICMEDLMSNSNFSSGDVIGGSYPTIADSAGVVREYLKYAFQSESNPTQYVLMGGKAPFAPVRFVKSPNQEWPSWQHVPSDIYFSDLSMEWIHTNSDYDTINQCEYEIPNIVFNSHSLPYYPDLFVGRLLCAKKEEIDNYSNKLYKYNFKPGNGNRSFLLNTLLFASNDSNISKYANRFVERTGNIFNSSNLNYTYIHNSLSNYLTGTQFVNYLNNNKCGYLSLYGHGEPQSIELYNNGHDRYVVSGLDSYIGDTLGIVPGITTINENGNGLDNLTNKHYPFICYSISCSTMPYDVDPTFNSFTTYEYKYNLGESFTLGKNYGGPAFLGNTRMGYLNESENFETEFLNTVLRKHIYSIGKAETLSKVFYKRKKDSYNHVVLEHNLLGDPEFEMWTSEPQRYTDITVNQYNNYIILNGIAPSDTIAFCDNDGNIGKTYGSDGFGFFVGISPTASIMVYNHDHIPYIAPLKLQNCNINNSQYVYASSFSAGKEIISNITHGNVAIKNGAIYEIEATDDVYLGEGFIVENGATFAVKTPGKVTIDGCVFQSGAKVKIEAGNVEFIGKFTAGLGSKVEFTQFIDE